MYQNLMNLSNQEVEIRRALSVISAQQYVTEPEAYQDVLERAVELTHSEIGYFHLYEEEQEAITLNVWSKAVLNMCTSVHDSHYPLKSAGILADCIRQRSPVIHNDYAAEVSAHGLPNGHFPVDRHLSLPVILHDRIVAVIGVGNKPAPYNRQDTEILQEFVHRAWPVLNRQVQKLKQERQRSGQRFTAFTAQETLDQMMELFRNMVNVRDRSLGSHQQEVARIAQGIAQEMGLSEAAQQGIRIGALLHDIGKMGIPLEILHKPAPLSAVEYELVKTHVRIGGDMLENLSFPWPLRIMIMQHHERLDGSGYPMGLHGNMIILEAKILAVADVYDAMSRDQPGRDSIPVEQTLQHLKDERGQLYDSYVVDALLRYLENPQESSSAQLS